MKLSSFWGRRPKSVAFRSTVVSASRLNSAALQRGIEIIVACPGRLLDLYSEGAIDFSQIEVLVLDEADRMFDMGFLPDIRRIIKLLPVQRQNLFFSATMPADIRDLADRDSA